MTDSHLPGLNGLTTNNIYCIGRNYAEHARELNNPIPAEPVLFTKPSVSFTTKGIIEIPHFVKEPHFETEIIVAIGKKGKHIIKEEAWGYIAGLGIGIDVTARDLQNDLKKEGKPWFIAKGLDTFAPVSPFVPVETLDTFKHFSFFLDINGKRRQTGTSADMLFPIPNLLETLSRYVTLLPGDLIFTGTPKGVGLLYDNDRLHAVLNDGMAELNVMVSFS